MSAFRFAALLTTLLIAAGITAFAACKGGDSTTPSPTATESAPATTSPSPTASPGATPFQGTRGPVERQDGTASPTPVLVDVRVGEHEGFDRAVFEFQGGLPGYRIEYVQPPITADASGLPVEIAGGAFLQARFSPAVAHDESGNPTASQELTPGRRSILEMKSTGDFEAVVTWVLGLDREVDFQVTDLQDPFRVVIDVAHP